MTARARKGTVRVTNWLAGWVDYSVAVVLTFGRLFRVPQRPAEPAHAPRDSGSPAHASAAQHWLVRPAEVAMLTVSFFLVAHLAAGGTDSVSAPQLNPFSMLSTAASAGELPPSVATTYARAPQGGTVVVVVSPAAALTASPAGDAPPASPTPEPVAAAAPPPDAGAMGASPATPIAPPPAPPTPEPPPSPTPAPPPAPSPTPAPAGPLTPAQVAAAAAAAGWPANLVDAAASVAWCESRNRPDAIGYGVTYGLMQLIPYWFEAIGADFGLWSDPVTNMRAALAAYQSDIASGQAPWSAWTCKPDHDLIH